MVVGILVGFEGFGSGAGAAGVLISGSSRDAVRRERELDRLGLGRVGLGDACGRPVAEGVCVKFAY